MKTRCRTFERLNIIAVVVIIACLSIFNVRVTETFADNAATVEKTSQEQGTSGSNDLPTTAPDTKYLAETEASEATGNTAKPADTSPKTVKTNGTSPLVYLGVGAAMLGAIGLAASSGGGSDSVDAPPEVPVVEPVVKPVVEPDEPEEPEESEESEEPEEPKEYPVESIEPVEVPAESNEKPFGADLDGDNWSGTLDLVDGKRENVSAVVHQNGSQVEIVTSTSQKYGRRFFGSINSSGHMRMVDQSTGELWTTHEGPANDLRIDLYDYVNNYQDLDNLLLKRSSK